MLRALFFCLAVLVPLPAPLFATFAADPWSWYNTVALPITFYALFITSVPKT